MNIADFKDVPVYSRLDNLRNSLFMADKEGYNVEFGVFNGKSINHLSSLYPDRQFHGFDSFEGLPEAWDRSNESVYKKGHFRLDNLPKVNNNVRLYKGFFDKTLPQWVEQNLGKVSFLHNDSDLYSSTIYVLNKLNHAIVPGTIIVFDELCDWGFEFDKGVATYPKWRDHEWKALNEWVSKFDRGIQIISRGNRFEATIRVTR